MKTFFYRIRIPLLEWYFVAATCYFCILGMNWNMLVVAIILGFVHTYLVEPIVYSLTPLDEDPVVDLQKREEKFLSWEKYKVLKECLKSFCICSLVMGVYYLVNSYRTSVDGEFFAVDPFTYGMLYWVFNKILGKMMKIWR